MSVLLRLNGVKWCFVAQFVEGGCCWDTKVGVSLKEILEAKTSPKGNNNGSLYDI